MGNDKMKFDIRSKAERQEVQISSKPEKGEMVRILWTVLLLNCFVENIFVRGSNKAPVITTQPSNKIAAKGAVTELVCNAKGSPVLQFKWFHNGKPITSTARQLITSNGNLYFSRVVHSKKRGYSDFGSYYCSVTNDYGTVQSKVVNLTIGYIRKTFRKDPSSQSVSEGKELVLTCNPPRGKPKPKVVWLKDNRRLLGDGKRILLENSNQRLVIKNFQKADEGAYTCQASNVAGRKLSVPAAVTRKVPPVFSERPKDQTVIIGTEAAFFCKAKGVPKPNIIWKKQGNKTVLKNTETLTLTKLNAGDEGTYICLAHNSEGNISSQARLTVQYPPQFAFVSPDAYVKEGTTLKLTCLANARPNPSIQWMNKTTKKYFYTGRKYGSLRIEQNDRRISLIISPVKKSDAGTYTCQAKNKIGDDDQDVKVFVHSKSEYVPRITTNNKKITADINSNTTLICDVEGEPKPSVSWFKVGMDRSLGDGIVHRNYSVGRKRRYVLNIAKVQESNAGTFQCHAVNKIDTDKEDIVLEVTRKLYLAEPLGVGVPSMPTDVKVLGRLATSVLISWNADQSGVKDPVFAYAVGYINVDERSNEKYASLSVVPLQYVVQNLKPNTRYRFFVRGVNSKGRGIPSLLSDVVKTKSAVTTTPVRPTTSSRQNSNKLNISLHAGGPGELVVSWIKFTKDEVFNIDGYYIFWKVKNGKKFHREKLQNDKAGRYTISDLQRSTKYAVQIQPFKKNILGPRSNIAYRKTSNKAIILKMNIQQNDSDSIMVTWRPLWKKNSGMDKVKDYTIWYTAVDNEKENYRKVISASEERYHFIIGVLNSGEEYKVWITVSTIHARRYNSKKKTITLKSPPVLSNKSSKSVMQKIKSFVLQPWFLGVLGGVLFIFILMLLICCLCKRSSSKKDADDLPIPLQSRSPPVSIRKPSESRNTESDALTPGSRGRESVSECESLEGRSGRVYRNNSSPSAPPPTSVDFPEIAITPNKYERMYRSLDARGNDVSYGRHPQTLAEDELDKSRYTSRSRNPYSPNPKPGSLTGDGRSDYDNERPTCAKHSPNHVRSRNPYPSDAPPDYETAIAENTSCGQNHNDDDDEDGRSSSNKDDDCLGRMPYGKERYGNPSSRQSSCSPASECSNQGSSIAGRRKGLKPLPRLTIASVNWADMLPPPPSHPPPSSVATRSPPPSPTATSMCSETTYGRSHASSFMPRRSGSVVSADMTSDMERATADSVLSGKSKGKSENKLPFDLAGITSDIIMQWADSVTNTSGSDNDSPCSSPSRVSGISSDGSFLTDTDFANAVKAAAECGGFNIDIDLNMYKAMDPISFQPFAGSLSTYNPENSVDPNKDSFSKPSSKKTGSRDIEGVRDVLRSGRGRRSRSALENPRDISRPSEPSVKETSPLISSTNPDTKNVRKPRQTNDVNTAGYVPALTRTSALGKLEPVNRGPVKKKYAIVKTLPQVQAEDGAEYTPNYPSHSLSSSTSNASTIRSSSCPPIMLTDDDMEEDDML